MRILVRPEEMESLADRMLDAAYDLDVIGQRVRRSIQSLDWETLHKERLKDAIDRVSIAASQATVELQEMAHFLIRKAKAFRDADAEGSDLIDQYEPLPPLSEGAQLAAASEEVKPKLSPGQVFIDKQSEPLSWFSIGDATLKIVGGLFQVGTSLIGAAITGPGGWALASGMVVHGIGSVSEGVSQLFGAKMVMRDGSVQTFNAAKWLYDRVPGGGAVYDYVDAALTTTSLAKGVKTLSSAADRVMEAKGKLRSIASHLKSARRQTWITVPSIGFDGINLARFGYNEHAKWTAAPSN